MIADCDQPLKRSDDEIRSIAKTVVENYDDEELRNAFLDLVLQLWVNRGVLLGYRGTDTFLEWSNNLSRFRLSLR